MIREASSRELRWNRYQGPACKVQSPLHHSRMVYKLGNIKLSQEYFICFTAHCVFETCCQLLLPSQCTSMS